MSASSWTLKEAARKPGRFTYGNDNPLNRIDPDGRIARFIQTDEQQRQAYGERQAEASVEARRERMINQALQDARYNKLERIFAIITMSVANNDRPQALVLAKKIPHGQQLLLPSLVYEKLRVQAACESRVGRHSPVCKWGEQWLIQPQQCGSNIFTCAVEIVMQITIFISPHMLIGRVAALATTAIAIRAAKIQKLNKATFDNALKRGRAAWDRMRKKKPNGCSFAPQTLVLLADGTPLPISQIRTGQRVRTTDPTTGRTGIGTVTAVHVHDDNDLLDLTISAADGSKSVIRTTSDHPIWDDTTDRWVAAGQLRTGHLLRSYTNNPGIRIAGTKDIPGVAVMWDITVEGTSTYYVIPTAPDGSTGPAALVHNCPLAGARDAALKAANKPWDMVIKRIHMAGGPSGKAKFASTNISEVRGWIANGLRDSRVVFEANPGTHASTTFRAIVDMGSKRVGTNGQTKIRVIVTNDGRVINSFPVHVR